MENNEAHALVAEKIVEQWRKDGKISMRKAAEAVGYAPQHSSLIAQSESFQKALFLKIPYDVLVDAQAKQLDARRVERITFYGCDSEDDVNEIVDAGKWLLIKTYTNKNGVICGWVIKPNWEQVDRALDKVYKLTGLYKAEKMEISTPIDDLTDEELANELIEEGQIVSLPQARAEVEQS